MRVLVAPQFSRAHAVGAYRLWWPAEALRDQGHDVTICAPPSDPKWKPSTAADFADARDFDVFVLQRPARRVEHTTMRVLQEAGVAVVVDVDDNMHALHPANKARWAPALDTPDIGRGWLAKCCRDADLVTVSTPALAERYAPHGRAHVLANCIPARYLDVTVKHARHVRVGWAGSIDTHPDDLQVTSHAVRDTIRGSGARFHVVGTGKGVRDALGLDDEPSTTGWVGLADYPAKVAGLDVGIVPLAPGVFNEAKSWLKGLEYAALGVPFVASPTQPYTALAERGAGWLAGPEAEWHAKVARLVGDADARRYLAETGRQAARGLTVEANAWRWAEAWATAREQRRAAA